MNNLTPNSQLPIASLITSRSDELGVSFSQIIARSGYGNLPKGLRRLNQLLNGDVSRAQGIIAKLPKILEVDCETVDQALQATHRRIQEDAEGAMRKKFKPHAIIICERQVPEPIWVAGVIGIDRILRIDFAEGSTPITFIDQAIKEVINRLGRWNSPALPAFGRPQGVVINYAHDGAVEFDLAGKPLRTFDRAIQLGVSTFALSGRPITASELDLSVRG